MELRHIRDFVAVAGELSFTRAALKLHVAQSSLSQQIKNLEEELGVRLLDRAGGRVALTREGRVYFVRARELLNLNAQSVKEVQNVGARGSAQLNLGFVPGFSWPALRVTLKMFRGRHPSATLRLLEMTSSEQLQALGGGDIQLGFFGSMDHLAERQLQGEIVARADCLVAVPADSAPAKRKEIDLTELEPSSFVGPSKDQHPDYHEWLRRVSRETGLAAKMSREAASVSSVLDLVAAGFGVAFAARAN
jgi:DNA-binding transcriptional LysR family regulator